MNPIYKFRWKIQSLILYYRFEGAGIHSCKIKSGEYWNRVQFIENTRNSNSIGRDPSVKSGSIPQSPSDALSDARCEKVQCSSGPTRATLQWGIVAVVEFREKEGEIDRPAGGESFAAMRHLNWLNADKLQRYILSPSRHHPPPLPPPPSLPSHSHHYRHHILLLTFSFSCTFSQLRHCRRGRIAVWKFPAGRTCEILPEGSYVSDDAMLGLLRTVSREALPPPFFFLLLSNAARV